MIGLMKKRYVVTLTLVALAAIGGAWLSLRNPSGLSSSPRGVVTASVQPKAKKTKARSSRAITAFLRPDTNVEAPIDDAAIAALSQDQRARRERQEAAIVESVRTKFEPLFKHLENLTASIGPDATEAQLKAIESASQDIFTALDAAIDETMDNPTYAALSDQLDAQMETFQTASLSERDNLLPAIQSGLEQLMTQIAQRATQKLKR